VECKGFFCCRNQAVVSYEVYSLIETANEKGIVPAHYLIALFEKAPVSSLAEDWELKS